MSTITIQQGDNRELLREYPDNHFDSVVTDCPYGLGKEPNAANLIRDWADHGYHAISGKGFMGNAWDAFVPQPLFWKEVYRVLKPGGHVLAFFGTRTYDWGTLAIRLAGFEIRDMICWHYGSGFPKSLNVSKAIAGMCEDVEFSEAWEGWGTALKPATEPICVARKPIEGNVALNVVKHGTGGINIDACRVAFAGEDDQESATYGTGTNIIGANYVGSKLSDGRKNIEANALGRFPANVILSPYMAAVMDEQTGVLTSGRKKSGYEYQKNNGNSMGAGCGVSENEFIGDSGGASRFFYCAKASQDERNAGCEGLAKQQGGFKNDSGRGISASDQYKAYQVENFHPTVKPIALMRYLLRMVTPKGGLALDTFAGSGTTGCAAAFEDINIVLMEMEEKYLPIIHARTAHWQNKANREAYLKELKESQLTLF